MIEICIPDFPAQVDQDVPREPRCLAAFPAESAGCIDGYPEEWNMASRKFAN